LYHPRSTFASEAQLWGTGLAQKTETVTVRIEPAVKALLKLAAQQDRRSLANMIEVMILDYCERRSIEPPAAAGSRAMAQPRGSKAQ